MLSMHVPNLRSIILWGALGTLGYAFSANNYVIKINQVTLIAMKEKKAKYLYTLIEKIILGEATP